MSKSHHSGRSLKYILQTTVLCIALGTVLYFVPIPTICHIVYSYTKEYVVMNVELRPEASLEDLYRLVPDVVFMQSQSSNRKQSCSIPGGDNARFDCYPGAGASAEACQARGCCWQRSNSITLSNNVKKQIDVPFCFFPINYPSYSVSHMQKTDYGFTAALSRSQPSPWPRDIANLTLDIYLETSQRLRFKIYDARNVRYEVPLDTPKPGHASTKTDYDVKVQQSPFGITVTRKSTGAVLFDSVIPEAPLIFSDQFIQISTKVPSKTVYGLGEHYAPLQKTLYTWSQYSFWNRDQPPGAGMNLYGNHPFFLSMEGDGNAHGVFLLNSNAMDVDLQPYPALTYRTIGGILDFYVFSGPSPDAVVMQYTNVIGLPLLPSYWSLGFHLCRYGYGSAEKLKTVIKRTRDGKFPYDTQWSDIDYMANHLDWTYDSQKYSDLPDIVKDLHQNDQHFVVIVDPGISSVQPRGSYLPYDQGLADNVFVKNASGQILIGAVWPGLTAFPDFTHPNATDYWYNSMAMFYKQVPFDGLWTDMNEPSNFVFGSTVGCTTSKLDKPPYTPGIMGNELGDRTVCPSAQQYLGSHYDLHNMYGHFEAIATRNGLTKLLGKRSLIISRSSFAGTGHFSGHWTGDNSATWDDLANSIPAVMNFQMYGIPQVGADICGFGSATTEELCTRWMQLGAFYPFMRNHNDDVAPDQDPAVWSKSAQDIMRSALQLRYSLLPYLYTLFYLSHVYGYPVVKPLSFQFPNDAATYGIDKQFLWGGNLMISPATDQGQTDVHAYFPACIWYNYFSGQRFESKGQWTDIYTPIDKINVHIREGLVLFTQKDEINTKLMRKNPFNITVALNEDGQAEGLLYWDDGESLDVIANKKYTLINVITSNATITSTVEVKGYTAESLTLAGVKVMGLMKSPSAVKVNNQAATFSFDNNQVLYVLGFTPVSLLETVKVQWS